ncbi:MAG: divalent-cation tolerance protein CutA [Luteimonas sp.]
MTALVCFCSCPDANSASRIVDALVDERVAARVTNVDGVRSVYRWQGRSERADQFQPVVKTVRERHDALVARIVELHPNELPEVIAVEIDGGLGPYLDWIGAQTRPEND